MRALEQGAFECGGSEGVRVFSLTSILEVGGLQWH